ncbi:MAG: N-acetyltransferase [Alphaproteobacteria bacterium]|nr:N-acetyltransferase [Alphaproteobacteria bacterium]
MPLRPATNADLGQIIDIWNPIIRDTDVTFNSVEKTRQSLKSELDRKAELGHPFLVAEIKGAVVGFATYGQFRASNGYARSMEHTIILADEARGSGLGRALMSQIEAHARARKIHSMWAGVSHRNRCALEFHRAIGYVQIACLPEVGWKFDRWYDLVLMQKIL